MGDIEGIYSMEVASQSPLDKMTWLKLFKYFQLCGTQMTFLMIPYMCYLSPSLNVLTAVKTRYTCILYRANLAYSKC